MSHPPSSTVTADVVVVGAGVIGSATALELAKAGYDVVVVDRAGGPGHGSTSASSAIIRFTYSTFDGVATAWESKFCWESWGEHLGLADDQCLARFRRTGMLFLDSPLVPRRGRVDLLESAGVPVEELDPDQVVARFPFLDNGRYWPPKPVTDDAFWDDAEGRVGGFLTPDAGFVDDPRLAADNLATAARARGARLMFHATVTAVAPLPTGGWRVDLADGRRVETAVVVNAAGPWSTTLNRMAGIGAEFTIGVRPLRQEVHQVRAPEGYGDGADGADPGPTVGDTDLGVYVRSGLHGTLLVGGSEPACDPLDWVNDPDEASMRVTRGLYDAQVTRAARRFPGLQVPNRMSGIAGVYDVADDWTPIYDRTDAPGFYVAMGTSGNQFKNAPLVGRFMAAVIEAVEGGHDHDAEPVRYRGEHTGLTIDLGAFSRKRERNAASSGTVLG